MVNGRYMSGKPLVPSIGGLIFSYNVNEYNEPVNISIEFVNELT